MGHLPQCRPPAHTTPRAPGAGMPCVQEGCFVFCSCSLDLALSCSQCWSLSLCSASTEILTTVIQTVCPHYALTILNQLRVHLPVKEQVQKRGGVPCSALRGPDQDKFSYSNKD